MGCQKHPDKGETTKTTSHDVGPDRLWLERTLCDECGAVINANSWREKGANN